MTLKYSHMIVIILLVIIFVLPELVVHAVRPATQSSNAKLPSMSHLKLQQHFFSNMI